jgi:hypothetical protein
MMEDIARHMVAAKIIDLEMEYGTTTYNLKTDSSAMAPASDNDGDAIEKLGVHQPTPSNYSPHYHINNSSCFPISPNYRKFMDIHRMKYIDRKGDKDVDSQVLKNSIGRRYNTYQVCKFEGRNIAMKHTVYCKFRCVYLCTESKKPTQELDLKRTANGESVTNFSWVFPDSNLSCWQTFETLYEPHNLFTNPGSIVDKQAKKTAFWTFEGRE